MSTVAAKLNPSINITDEAFNPSEASSSHLSMQLGSSFFSYAVLNISTNKYVALKHYNIKESASQEDLKHILESDENLKKEYKTVQSTFINQQAVLVPKPFFKNNLEKTYLEFNTSVSEGNILQHDLLKNSEAYNIYPIPLRVKDILKRAFPKVQLVHHSTSLIESLILNYKNISEKVVFINVREAEFDIVVLLKGKLHFYNSFSYKSIEDFTYYTLFVYEQLKLNPEKEALFLAGDIEKNSGVYNSLYKYIRNVSFAKRNDNFEYTYGFNHIPGHSFYNLFNQYLCY